MFEIQYHPADIRKPVRYFFLSRTGARRVAIAGGLLAVVLVVGLALTPLGLQGLLVTSRLHHLETLNRMQHEVLARREAALGILENRAEKGKTLERQISLILGTGDDTKGTDDPSPLPSDLHEPQAREAMLRARALNRSSEMLLTRADELVAFALHHEQLIRTVPSICPIAAGEFVLTSPFGERISPFTNGPDFHSGIDLAAREGTPVMATGDGKVIFAGRFPLKRNARWWRFGNVVVLRHGDAYLTIYAHLKDIKVKRGRKVKRGEEIGTVGNSGWSTSPHLHYEVRALRNGEDPIPVDPRIHILDHQWKGHEAMLIAGRSAPRPNFEPLPSRLR